jgi:hypothetical protein
MSFYSVDNRMASDERKESLFFFPHSLKTVWQQDFLLVFIDEKQKSTKSYPIVYSAKHETKKLFFFFLLNLFFFEDLKEEKKKKLLPKREHQFWVLNINTMNEKNTVI